MPNVDFPSGLKSLGVCLSGLHPPRVMRMTKDASEATAIFAGDAVNQEADGNIEAASATPGTTLYSGVSLTYGAAATLTYHDVVVSVDALFHIQDNNDTDGFAEADRGLNCNLELNAGNAITGQSGHELDESTAAVTATLDVKLHNLLGVPTNSYGANGRWVVSFNKHRNAPGVAGV
jgi:hypothetical protein